MMPQVMRYDIMGVLLGTIQTYIPYSTTYAAVQGENFESTEHLYNTWYELHPFTYISSFLLVLNKTITLEFDTSIPNEELEYSMIQLTV